MLIIIIMHVFPPLRRFLFINHCCILDEPLSYNNQVSWLSAPTYSKTTHFASSCWSEDVCGAKTHLKRHTPSSATPTLLLSCPVSSQRPLPHFLSVTPAGFIYYGRAWFMKALAAQGKPILWHFLPCAVHRQRQQLQKDKAAAAAQPWQPW